MALRTSRAYAPAEVVIDRSRCNNCGICTKVCPIGKDRDLYGSRNSKFYIEESEALKTNPDDPRYSGLVHLRRHGSGGTRIA